MLYNGNVILYKLFYRKRLLFGLYKHSIYSFYHTAQFEPLNFAKFWKQRLGLVFMRSGTCASVTQKEMLRFNL